MEGGWRSILGGRGLAGNGGRGGRIGAGWLSGGRGRVRGGGSGSGGGWGLGFGRGGVLGGMRRAWQVIWDRCRGGLGWLGGISGLLRRGVRVFWGVGAREFGR